MALDENEKKALGNLKKRRGVVKAALTKVQTFITKFNPRNDAIAS